jgi:SAM-dependent methyltransferase
MSQNPFEQRQAWSESAPYWAKHREIIRAMFAPISAAMIEDLLLGQGSVVLDVASGVGEPSIAIARVCWPGWVACTDAVGEMVKTAQRASRIEGVENLHGLECVAEALPFRSAAFDAAVCRLGVMFSFNPLLSIREMLRILKPGGRLSLAVWGSSELNPFFTVTAKAVGGYLSMPPPDPDAPGAFRFAEPGKLAKLFSQAGAVDVAERRLNFRIEAPIELKDYWKVRSEMSELLRSKASQLSASQLAAVDRDVQQEAARFFSSGGMSFPAVALLVRGTKPTH